MISWNSKQVTILEPLPVAKQLIESLSKYSENDIKYFDTPAKDDDEKIKRTVKAIYDLKVEHVAPSHCTGEKAMELFETIYKNKYIKSGVGNKIII